MSINQESRKPRSHMSNTELTKQTSDGDPIMRFRANQSIF